MPVNELGQPIGRSLGNWSGAKAPGAALLEGHWCRLERLDADRHAPSLFKAFSADELGANFTYLSYEPFAGEDACHAFLKAHEGAADPFFYVIVDQVSGEALGVLSYLRVDPAGGSIEVGHVHFGKALQKTPLATEAVFLMMQQAFADLGYRRFEWKCDDLNAGSRRAALRFGFTYEGTFRNATVYKGRSRDTAWFSITDAEWPLMRATFETWLKPENFDGTGAQKRKLQDIRAELEAAQVGK